MEFHGSEHQRLGASVLCVMSYREHSSWLTGCVLPLYCCVSTNTVVFFSELQYFLQKLCSNCVLHSSGVGAVGPFVTVAFWPEQWQGNLSGDTGLFMLLPLPQTVSPGGGGWLTHADIWLCNRKWIRLCWFLPLPLVMWVILYKAQRYSLQDRWAGQQSKLWLDADVCQLIWWSLPWLD